MHYYKLNTVYWVILPCVYFALLPLQMVSPYLEFAQTSDFMTGPLSKLFSPCLYFTLLPLQMFSPCLEFAKTRRNISLYTVKFMLSVTLTRRNTAPRRVALTLISRSRGKEIPKLSASVNNSLPSPDHCLVTRPT